MELKKISETEIEITTKSIVLKDELLSQRENLVMQIVQMQEQLKQIDEKLGLFTKEV